MRVRLFAGTGLIVIAIVTGSWYVAWILSSAREDNPKGVVEVPAETFYAREFRVYGSEIGYEIEVISGPAVDIYIVNVSDYQRYLAGLPLVPGGNRVFIHENTRYADATPYPPAGTYYAIVDNTEYGAALPNGETVRARYDIIVSGGPAIARSIGGMIGILSLVSLMAIAGVFLVMDDRSRVHRSAETR